MIARSISCVRVGYGLGYLVAGVPQQCSSSAIVQIPSATSGVAKVGRRAPSLAEAFGRPTPGEASSPMPVLVQQT